MAPRTIHPERESDCIDSGALIRWRFKQAGDADEACKSSIVNLIHIFLEGELIKSCNHQRRPVRAWKYRPGTPWAEKLVFAKAAFLLDLIVIAFGAVVSRHHLPPHHFVAGERRPDSLHQRFSLLWGHQTPRFPKLD